MHKKIFFILLTLISLTLSVNFAYADLEIPGKEILKEVSIHSDSFQDTKNVSGVREHDVYERNMPSSSQR